MPDSNFQLASERLALSVNAIAMLAQGQLPKDSFYSLRALDHDDHLYGKIIDNRLDEINAQSDRDPIVWESGRGLSGLGRCPDAIFPHVWTSAHQAAQQLSRIVLRYFFWPLDLPDDSSGVEYKELTAKQKALFGNLLAEDRRKAIVMPLREVAIWQERIRRERAKLSGSINAVWLGNGVVRIGDEPVALEFQEATVLQALIELGEAATRPDIEKRTRVKDVAEIMKRLEERFPDFITRPGGRGKGGYSRQ